MSSSVPPCWVSAGNGGAVLEPFKQDTRHVVVATPCPLPTGQLFALHNLFQGSMSCKLGPAGECLKSDLGTELDPDPPSLHNPIGAAVSALCSIGQDLSLLLLLSRLLWHCVYLAPTGPAVMFSSMARAGNDTAHLSQKAARKMSGSSTPGKSTRHRSGG